MQVKDSTGAWLIGLVALLIFGCVGSVWMNGLFDDLPGQVAGGQVEEQVGPALTQTAGALWAGRVEVENSSAATDLARSAERAERVQGWRIGAGVTFYGVVMLVLVAGSFGGSAWWAVHVWRKVQEARMLPLVRELGGGLKIVYPALMRGHPMIVDTVTGGSWPLYDAMAVQEARVRYMERIGVVDRLAEGAENIAKSTRDAKPGDWLHQVAECSKVEGHNG